MQQRYDRTAEDVGNIVELGHVNTRIPDQRLATAFYVSGLGLTRDPYLMTGTNNMWINAGRSQFHLPTGEPQRLRGVTGLVVPNLPALLDRLTAAREELAGTAFAFAERDGAVEATSPWGNRLRLHAPDESHFGPVALALPYVAFDVPPGTAARIAAFYRTIFGARAAVAEERGRRSASVSVGEMQRVVFRESDAVPERDDGDHVQISCADFSGPYGRLLERGLVTEESDRFQYRFANIVDLDTGETLFTIEHEVRSMSHPLFGRPLVNRNAELSVRRYRPGRESIAWATG